MERKTNRKIVFILGSISCTHCIKRVKSFISQGYDVEIYGFDRGVYNINAQIDGKTIHILGHQQDGKNYMGKFFQTIKEVRKILKKHNGEDTLFYSTGFIDTLSLKLNGCNNYIYEISDILYGYKRFNLIRWLLKYIDIFLIRHSVLTVLTSAGFAKFFFGKNMPKNIIIQPNKLDFSFFGKKRPDNIVPQSIDSLNFSYVGAFRSPNTIFRFARIIGEKYPNHQFHFYGDSIFRNEVIEIANSYDNVKYHGPFKNPDDLVNIYSNIDIVVACYDTQSLNEQILEPNKLYEALYFRKPIIVSENTFLAERVKELGCGFVINATDDYSIISFLNSITRNDLERIYKNIDKIQLEDIIDDNSKKIISYLKADNNVSK